MSKDKEKKNKENTETAMPDTEETVSENGQTEAQADEAAEKPAEAAQEPQEDLQTQYLRLAADFQNFRRRTENEKKDIYAYANEKFALDLLGVIDNFERAMDALPEGETSGFSEGMQMILKQLTDVLTKNNITEIESIGKPFDPNFHNAMLTEDSEEYASGTVTKVFQKGYMLNTKVIRPAMVVVAN